MTDRKPYAIIRTGSKQYRVHQGDILDVELLGDAAEGNVEFNEILFYSDGTTPRVGLPLVEGCIVKGELLDRVRGPKVISYKFKRRKKYRRKIGHRQNYSRVKITAIEG